MTKREQILQAALKLFIEQGFDKTPTSAISKSAGVATGTLFHHFKTKEDLISALYVEIKLEMGERLAPVLKDKTDVRSMHREIWTRMLTWILDNPDKYRFLHQFGESALISANSREKVEEAFSGFHELTMDAVEQGVFRPFPVELIFGIMGSHIYATSNYLIEQHDLWAQPEMRDHLFESFWQQMAL